MLCQMHKLHQNGSFSVNRILAMAKVDADFAAIVAGKNT